MRMDEARIGQQGSRPAAVKQTMYDWAYAYAAVEPATGFGSALLAPHVNTATMNTFQKVLSTEVDAGDFVVLMMEQAGWHTSKGLDVPENIVILRLPPYAPELKAVENLWGYMRSHQLSNRVYDDHDRIVREIGNAYAPFPRKCSACRCEYAERAL